MKTFKTIVGALVIIMGFYVVVTIIQILFGWTETTFEEIRIPFFIIIAFFIFKAIRIYQKDNYLEKEETEKLEEEVKSYSPPPKKTSTLIITASEDTCSNLVTKLKEHPLVVDTYEDTGNWYTNGETGPEWFTANIKANYKHKEEIEKLVDEYAKGEVFNLYWS